MTVPTRTELHAEVDRLFREQHPAAPEKLDPDDQDQSSLVQAWLEIRDTVVNEWTNKVFFEHFPDAGKLDPQDPGDQQLIDYWLDIRNQIRDAATPRYNWDDPTAIKDRAAGDVERSETGFPLTLHDSIPLPLEWAEGVEPVNAIATTFREEYNRRLSMSVYAGPTAVSGFPIIMGTTEENEDEVREWSVNRIADIARSIATRSQQEAFWDAYYRVALTSAIEATEIMRPAIDHEPGVAVISDLRIPIAALYLAKRPGMMLAWLDAAILKATATESERIQVLKDASKAQHRIVSFITSLPVWPEIPGLIADTVSIVLDETEPDLDRDFASYQAALDQFRHSCERVAETLFRNCLLRDIPRSEIALHPEIGVFVSGYKGSVLAGWDEEIQFLGIR